MRRAATLTILGLVVIIAIQLDGTQAAKQSEYACQLVGPGACRGRDWSDDDWPVLKGDQTKDQCCQHCLKTRGCTSFHLGKGTGAKAASGKRPCLLFGHRKVVPATALGGECYIVKRDGNAEIEDRVQLKKKEKASGESASQARGQKKKDVARQQQQQQQKPKATGASQNEANNKRGNQKAKVASKKPLADDQQQEAKKSQQAQAKNKEKGVNEPSKKQSEKVQQKPAPNKKPAAQPAKKPSAGKEDKKAPPKKDKKKKKPASTPTEIPLHAHPKGSQIPPYLSKKKYNGQYLHLVGEGGCRGIGWNEDAGWPLFKGRQTFDKCAQLCAYDDVCSSFHVLRHDGQTYECLLFRHKEVIAVERLGGGCFELDNEPEGEEHEDPSLYEVPLDGPVELVNLGHGMCRGPNWTYKKWPVLKGYLTLKQCGVACAKRRGCMAFDVSRQQGKKFNCILYGHTNVAPASGVPGECYTLQDRWEEAVGRDYDLEEEEDPDDSLTDEEDDDDDESDSGEDFPYEVLGEGMCRGPGWASADNNWPKVKLHRSAQGCANACADKAACTAFDLSEENAKGKFKCHLYSHKDPQPASGVPGTCYVLADSAEKKRKPERAEKKSAKKKKKKSTAKNAKTDDSDSDNSSSEEGYIHLGDGLCRGPHWQDDPWPLVVGPRSLAACYQACQIHQGCTAFDLSPVQGKKKLECLLFGHEEVRPAQSLKGNCYLMVEESGQTSTQADDDDDDDEYEVEVKGDMLLDPIGIGACRGPGWQDGGWPKVRGRLSLEECGKQCLGSPGCTAFHASPTQESDVFECFLFGHRDVRPASGVRGDCYRAVTDGEVVVTLLADKKQSGSGSGSERKKKYKIPEFDEPTIVSDDLSNSPDDEEWLFEPPPPELRSRKHIAETLGLNKPRNQAKESLVEKTLKELKKVYENAIQPLETTYKYRELSNRHFGDPEMFNKPLIVLMGPWSGGKSTMINYLLGTEYTKNAFRAAAEPSPGFNFNLAMWGDREEELEGDEIAAEWSFSSLQKFGQAFMKKLRGKKMPNNLLERATFAEIPGVLETGTLRKVDRQYPFNDACQWFIDHADLILLVYDYAKLDIGPETEALLDQLKGRETQVRIVLNKADEITAEELLQIQRNLVWNVSPLMSSLEPPTLYAGSFWSRPYKEGAPKRLLTAQENSLLQDIRQAIDKRLENRIATARRFAVRVRNHAKMVDCYLTTYNNQKSLFGDKKATAARIINRPQDYHIYEGLSAMTNISRYDLPDPDTYRAFFGLHPLYDFPSLASTCTFFKGCPINKLDQAIAYDLPELLTTARRAQEDLVGKKSKSSSK